MKQTFDKMNGIQLPVSEPNELGVFRNTEDFAYETPEYSVQVGLVRCEDGYRTSISINKLKGDYHGFSCPAYVRDPAYPDARSAVLETIKKHIGKGFPFLEEAFKEIRAMIICVQLSIF